MKPVFVVGSFDHVGLSDIRLLHEASKWGPVRVLLSSDEAIAKLQGQAPQCPAAERQYMLNAMRYVDRVLVRDCLPDADVLPQGCDMSGGMWVLKACDANARHAAWCRDRGIDYRVVPDELLQAAADPPTQMVPQEPGRPKVLVTGCYDWFHSGHVRFFEEVSQLGTLYVIVGHDENIRLLKGEGHPMFPASERRYIVESISFVHQALVSTGHGWLDAEPEIRRILPDIYAVNEDGDHPQKRKYCEAAGIAYRVLTRVPKDGLPRRQSTDLRGF